jgi:hypothetical protein
LGCSWHRHARQDKRDTDERYRIGRADAEEQARHHAGADEYTRQPDKQPKPDKFQGCFTVIAAQASDAGLTTEYFPTDIYVNPVRS